MIIVTGLLFTLFHLPPSLSAPSPTLHRRSRETGLHEEAELEEHEALFDYVEEEEYARLIQQRQEEGFILDDGE